ncbi:hypothetical protein [Rhizobium leguminosarum]
MAAAKAHRPETSPGFGKCRSQRHFDVAALILAENVERRNLSVGQRAAMARAILKPKGERGKRTDLNGKSITSSRPGALAEVAKAEPDVQALIAERVEAANVSKI